MDLSAGKIRQTEVKESTSSVQVEASTLHHGEPQGDLEVEYVKTEEVRKYNKMNHIHLPLHLHKRTTTPTTMMKDKKKEKTMKRMFHPNPNKSFHELERESKETIPSNKSSMIFKPGELLALKLV